MAHLLRILSDAQLKRWLVLTGQNLADIDQNTLGAWNGAAGGSWTPAADIVIEGKGVVIGGPWTMDGADSTVDTDGDDAPLVFGRGTADDVFGFDTPASITLVSSLFTAFPDIAETFVSRVKAFNGAPSITGAVEGTQSLTPGSRFLSPLRVYDGGTIQTATLEWLILDDHTAVGGMPEHFPLMRIVAVDTDGNVFPLRSADASTDDDGFQAISTATDLASYAATTSNTFGYVCNQNQLIDRGKYTYWVDLIDESGAHAWSVAGLGTVFAAVSTVFDGIALVNGRP